MAASTESNKSKSRISARVGAVAESATLAIDAKAKALKAAGEDVIGFGAGEPDFPTPEHVVEAAIAACRDPKMHKYTPAAGQPELREALAAKTKRDSGYDVAANQVVVTNGGKQAVEESLATILDPGDEVIVPAPYWTTYPESIGLTGAKMVPVLATVKSGFRVTVDQLEKARTPKTKALLFNSPSNPTGAVYTKEQMLEIGRWANEHGLWVVTDEIYEHLVYGDAKFHSLPVLVPELADRTIVLNGVAKTYAMTGWRVGWIIAPPDVAKAAANLHSHSSSNVANVSQRAALAAVSGSLDGVAEMKKAYLRRRDKICSMLGEIPGVECPVPDGAFYVYPSFEGVLGKKIGGSTPKTTLELAGLVLEKAKVAFVPGEAFGAPGGARFSYALADDQMVEGINRVAKLLG